MATMSRGHAVDRDLRVLTGPASALLVCVIVAVGLFEALWFVVVTGSGPAAVDPAVLDWMVAHRGAALTIVARLVTDVGSPTVTITGSVVAVGWWAWRRDRRRALLGAAGLVGLLVVDVATKSLVARPRPPLPFHAVVAHGYSFPSGHAMLSAGVALLVLWLLREHVVAMASAVLRTVLVGAVVLAVVAVGLSRVVLAVHYPSDVLAGWALAVLVVAVIALVDVLRAGRR